MLAFRHLRRSSGVIGSAFRQVLDQNKAATISTIQWEFFGLNFSPVVQSSLRQFSTVPGRVIEEDLVSMTDEELDDNSTIPGWEFVHSPPRTMPRGALVGTVVSDKMNKTVNVAVERYRIVPKYRKRLRYTRKFMAHDEKEVANVGDLVMIVPCHRISKRKHFMLREIIRATGQL